MPDQERIVKAVYDAVDKVNQQLPKGLHIDKSPDAMLYGKSSALESLDYVTLIMEVESQIKEEFGVEIILTDENLLSKQKSPLTTLRTLTEYLTGLLQERENTSNQ